MRPIAVDVAWSVCLSVGHNHEMAFGLWTGVGPSNKVLGLGRGPPAQG